MTISLVNVATHPPTQNGCGAARRSHLAQAGAGDVVQNHAASSIVASSFARTVFASSAQLHQRATVAAAASLAAVMFRLRSPTRRCGVRTQQRLQTRYCVAAAQESASISSEPEPLRVMFLGGSGRIGVAAAAHFATRWTPRAVHLYLVGRDEQRGAGALDELKDELVGISNVSSSFHELDWTAIGALDGLLAELQVDALLHTAGPFDGDLGASVLQSAIKANVPVYVDVADPMEYIASARAMMQQAQQSGTMALVSAGAFPGFSNVLAVECARRLCSPENADDTTLKDLNFAYFTAGLGGSGPINLLITNLGFGEPVPIFRDGKYDPQMIAGAESRRVPFFIKEGDAAFELVGERDVWPWPFPEAGTVAEHLGITGNSSTGMGTAPGIWNTILVALVALVPRDLWRQRWFSEGLAWFSLPMVWVTDQFVNETHAIRVEVTASDGRKAVAVQTHRSFRQCVAQSAAEFTLALLQRRDGAKDNSGSADAEAATWKPGVWLPEELADDGLWRPQLLQRLSSTEGTVSCEVEVTR